MIIEYDKALLRNEYNGNIDKMTADGMFLEWTPERIKGAFNFGNGTEKHLKEYMNNNKQYCIFIDK